MLFWTIAGVGAFSNGRGDLDDSAFEFGYRNPVSESMGIFIWILIFALPVVWVWRKPIWKLVKQVWKLVKQALNFLNKKAEED